MPLFLGLQRWFTFDDKTPFPGAKAILYVLYVYVYVLVCFWLFVFKPRRNVALTCLMFFVLTRYTTALKGNSLSVQWLGLGTFAALGPDSISGPGTKILELRFWHGDNKKTPQVC